MSIVRKSGSTITEAYASFMSQPFISSALAEEIRAELDLDARIAANIARRTRASEGNWEQTQLFA